MNNQLDNVDQTAADAIVPGCLDQELHAENAGRKALKKQAKNRIEKCEDLLRQAKAAVVERQPGAGFAEDSVASVERASEYSAVDEEYQAQVIPPPGKSLQFSNYDGVDGTALCIEPASREGYYYVTTVGWQHDHEHCSSFADGPREPVLSDEIWATCQRFQFDDLVDDGVRFELACVPQKSNRWQFGGHVSHRHPVPNQHSQTEHDSADENPVE